MSGPSKEKINEVMTKGSLYIGVPAEVDILKDAYKEAVEALKETDKALMEITMSRPAYSVSRIVQRNKEIIDKCPEEK